jgi:hypothetical protein
LTSALDGMGGQRHAPAALYTWGKYPWYVLHSGLRGPHLVWTKRLEEKSFSFAGDRNPFARLSSLYADTIVAELPWLCHGAPKDDIIKSAIVIKRDMVLLIILSNTSESKPAKSEQDVTDLGMKLFRTQMKIDKNY